MARSRRSPHDNRDEVELPNNPGQTTEEVRNAPTQPERAEASRPNTGGPVHRVRDPDALQDGEPTERVSADETAVALDNIEHERTESRGDPVEPAVETTTDVGPGPGEVVDRDRPDLGHEFVREQTGGAPIAGAPEEPDLATMDSTGDEGGDPHEPADSAGGVDMNAGMTFRPDGSPGPLPGEDVAEREGDARGGEDVRSATDRVPTTRELVRHPDDPRQLTEEVRPPSSTNLLDTAHLAHEDRQGSGRVLGVVPVQEGEEPTGSALPEQERAELTIFNTRPGDEPGREMRDTTREAPEQHPTGASAPEIGPATYSAGYDPLDGLRKARGEAKLPEPTARERIKHEDLAVAMMRAGIQELRQSGRGDDFHFLRTSLNYAAARLPFFWRKLTKGRDA